MIECREGMRTRARGVVVAVVCAGALLAFSGASASAAPGDTFYLSQSKKTFVSFVIGAGGDQITRLGYTAKKLPCDKGKALKGMTVPGLGSAPIQENLVGQPFFESFWAQGVPGWGGIAGKIGDTGVKGSLFLQATRKVHQKKVWCRSGNRSWNAKPVSEDTWLAAREKQGYRE